MRCHWLRHAAALLIVAAAVTALMRSTSGPTPAESSKRVAFGALGDAPYYLWKDWR